jgi:hypothetical protein
MLVWQTLWNLQGIDGACCSAAQSTPASQSNHNCVFMAPLAHCTLCLLLPAGCLGQLAHCTLCLFFSPGCPAQLAINHKTITVLLYD